MPSSLFFYGALTGGLARVAHAYTQVNIASPFMYKTIDSIVFPGSYDQSHLHSFFGSDAVTANTATSAELQEGCTNAENPNDLSIYWIPTLVYTSDGSNYEPVPMSRFSAYYNLGETPAEVAIPQDLQMIAGDAGATSEGDIIEGSKVQWMCENDDGSIAADENGFPSSTCDTHLQTVLFFPQCVNVDTLETAYKSRDHGTDNWCPEGSSSMPQLRFSIRYDLREALPDGWSGTAPVKLACGNAWCSHGDFINGWTEEAAEAMIATTSSKQEFAAVDGALGADGEQPDCEATDAEPDKGTSDYAESVKRRVRRAVDAAGWKSKSRFA